MAALRVAILLDADTTVVSFQTVYHALKEPAVQTALLKVLEARRGLDVFTPTRDEITENISGPIEKSIGMPRGSW